MAKNKTKQNKTKKKKKKNNKKKKKKKKKKKTTTKKKKKTKNKILFDTAAMYFCYQRHFDKTVSFTAVDETFLNVLLDTPTMVFTLYSVVWETYYYSRLILFCSIYHTGEAVRGILHLQFNRNWLWTSQGSHIHAVGVQSLDRRVPVAPGDSGHLFASCIDTFIILPADGVQLKTSNVRQ